VLDQKRGGPIRDMERIQTLQVWKYTLVCEFLVHHEETKDVHVHRVVHCFEFSDTFGVYFEAVPCILSVLHEYDCLRELMDTPSITPGRAL
jgi:hypothetical protein